MANVDYLSRSYRSTSASDVDARAFLNRVYLWMTVGLGLTGVTAMYVASTPSLIIPILQNHLLFYGLFAAQFGIVLAFSALASRVGSAAAAAMFLAYAVLTGVTFSVLLLAYTGTSVATTFFITAGTFAGMSVFGAVTKSDLSSWRSFLMMGLWGVVLASIVNLFVGGGMLSWVIGCVGVLVFTGLTAYDTQKIRALAHADGAGSESPLAIQGALVLYLDFINLFVSLLRLTGNRR